MSTENNPLLVREGLPRYDEITPEHVEPAIDSLLEQAEARIAELEQNAEPTWDGLLEPLEEIDAPFAYAWGPVSHLLSVKNSDALRQAHEAVLPKMVAFVLRIEQSCALYDSLCMSLIHI